MNNIEKNKRAIVSWTGGKDCALAYHLASQLKYNIIGLVTFSSKFSTFRAHPEYVIEKQANEIGVNWQNKKVENPYETSYESALQEIKVELNIEYLITGDIDFIDRHNGNYMFDRCNKVGLKIFNPLWQKSRKDIWSLLLRNHFEIQISFVRNDLMSEDWLSKVITKNNFSEFKTYCEENNIDLCGENGEFHTRTLNSPNYNKSVKYSDSIIIRNNNYSYLS